MTGTSCAPVEAILTFINEENILADVGVAMVVQVVAVDVADAGEAASPIQHPRMTNDRFPPRQPLPTWLSMTHPLTQQSRRIPHLPLVAVADSPGDVLAPAVSIDCFPQ